MICKTNTAQKIHLNSTNHQQQKKNATKTLLSCRLSLKMLIGKMEIKHALHEMRGLLDEEDEEENTQVEHSDTQLFVY